MYIACARFDPVPCGNVVVIMDARAELAEGIN